MIPRVRGARGLLEVVAHDVRRGVRRGALDRSGELAEPLDQLALELVVERFEAERAGLDALEGHLRLGEDRAHAGVRVLDLVDGVLLGLVERHVEVEQELGVRLAHLEEEARDVDAHLLVQLAQRHAGARALRELDLLAVALHAHHLVQDVLGVALREAERAHSAQDARNRAVVVGALDVDHAVIAAVPLVLVVRDVREEVRRHPVAPDHHTVLLISELGGSEPGSAVLLVDEAGLSQLPHRLVHETVGVEGGLQEVLVEVHPEVAQITILLRPQELDGERADLVERLGRVVREVLVADLVDERLRNLGHVAASIAVDRQRLVVPEELPVARTHAQRQQLHLSARVVVVVLPMDVPAGPIEERGDRVTQRGLPSVAQVERPGGVGRHELDHDRAAFADVAPPVGGVGLENVVEHRCDGPRAEAEVQESGTGHLDGLHTRRGEVEARHEVLGDRPRSAAELLGQGHGDVAGQVSVRGVPWTLQPDLPGVRAQVVEHRPERSSDLVLSHATCPTRRTTRSSTTRPSPCRTWTNRISSASRRIRRRPSSCTRPTGSR